MHTVNQEDRWQISCQDVQLVQVPLVLMVILRYPGQGEEQDGCVTTPVPIEDLYTLS